MTFANGCRIAPYKALLLKDADPDPAVRGPLQRSIEVLEAIQERLKGHTNRGFLTPGFVLE